MIRVLVVDDHPALRAGLRAVLDAEPGIAFAGESSGEEESVWPVMNRNRPDLILLDYHLPRGDGLQLCYRIKHEVPAPRVIVFSAYANANLALPAALAGADGLLAKDVGARDLFHSIRAVHAGERLVPPVSAASLEEASERLDPGQRALIAMLLDGCGEAEIADTIRQDPRDVRNAVHRILHTLRLDIPTTGTRG
jgi:DNA-binding NarL/FixJ family response regulator